MGSHVLQFRALVRSPVGELEVAIDGDPTFLCHADAQGNLLCVNAMACMPLGGVKVRQRLAGPAGAPPMGGLSFDLTDLLLNGNVTYECSDDGSGGAARDDRRLRFPVPLQQDWTYLEFKHSPLDWMVSVRLLPGDYTEEEFASVPRAESRPYFHGVQCIGCLERPATVRLLNPLFRTQGPRECHHLCYCEGCYEQSKVGGAGFFLKCPLCRADVRDPRRYGL